MSSFNFVALEPLNTSSLNHRCVMVSNELEKKGYESKVFNSGSIMKIPNLINSIKNWKKISEDLPQIIIIHRTSNVIDYRIIKKLKGNVKIIYDFDDAIFHTRFPGIIFFSHIKRVIAEVDTVFSGSHYLFDYASKLNNNTVIVPTAVDTELFNPVTKKRDKDKIVIGWMGNGDNYQLRYLKLLKEPLKILSKKYDLKFRIISALSNKTIQEFGNEPYEVDFGLDKWVPIEYMPEIISDFDIGVMPLTNGELEKGKCAMKALEYMSMGIPVVASAVGENNYVIKNGYNGFLAHNKNEWINNLEKLILNSVLRKKIGKNACNFVKDNYSLKIVVKKFIESAKTEVKK